VCAACRLRSSIVAKQLARSRTKRINVTYPTQSTTTRFLSTARVTPQQAAKQQPGRSSAHIDEATEKQDIVPWNGLDPKTPAQAALHAREVFGDALPEGFLDEEGYKAYERLYGTPLKFEEVDDVVDGEGVVVLEEEEGTGVLREGQDGELEEVAFEEGDVVDEGDEGSEAEVLGEDGEDVGVGVNADGKRRFIPREGDENLVDDINAAFADGERVYEDRGYTSNADEEEPFMRAHPLTIANRFGTSPATLALPQHSLVDAIEQQLAGTANVHLEQAAHRVFGGTGLPYSTSTPALGKTMQQKPISLDASQIRMSDMEADAFIATLMPGMYASVMSVLVETRKRLGSAWAEELVRKAQKSELRILDAGGAGAGILAVRELIRAEWERMHEEDPSLQSNMALAEADGKIGGASASAPLGTATVLAGSDTLRKRASQLLENTTFVPRLPDYLHTEEAKKKGKFDIVIAPYTLWQLKEDYVRKSHMQNLWSMLSQDGGVMVLLEKGIPRGFELVAAARNYLLESRIASGSDDTSNSDQRSVYAGVDTEGKEKGMIIAPCTNHEACPMYMPQGMVKGRRDICHFAQRYVRPPFLQRILGAKDKNWEDVKFSYISVMRGRDLREQESEEIEQSDAATKRAFEGYGIPNAEAEEHRQPRHERVPHSLSLPRAVLPPLKRRGHVILDLCTPSGTLERWNVPRSFSKQAYRDARKSSWGDLWALGAKTSVPRTPKIKKRTGKADLDVKTVKRKKAISYTEPGAPFDHDEYGRIVLYTPTEDSAEISPTGGVLRGRKVKGIRDKRDKTAAGNGRRRFNNDE